MAIEPESSTERKKLADVLEMMKRQDPTFRARENEETGQTLISGMGELHLEVIKHRLLRDFRLNVRVHKPRVSYRETIERRGGSHRRVPPQRGRAECSRPSCASAWSPSARGRSRSRSRSRPAAIELPEEFLAAAVEVLSEQGEGGGTLGFPLMHVKITVLGGEVPRNRLQRSWPSAMPPATPSRRPSARRASCCWSRSCGWRSPRRRNIWATSWATCSSGGRSSPAPTTAARNTVIDAQAPLANLFGYSSAMRGLSQGRATCTMEPHSYGPAPAEVLEGFL